MVLVDAIAAADRNIRPHVRETPLDASHAFSRATGAEVYLKLENLQYTGSFKLRGAMNKLLSLTGAQRARGVVAASSGNHGAAVAYGCHALGVRGVVYVPRHASPVKVAAMQQYGVEVRFHGDDSLLSELEARRFAAGHDLAYISPYNDAVVIAGQGTLAAELGRQAEAFDAVFVSVGGGGLIGGIGAYLRAFSPRTRIVGCLPANSPVMAVSQEAGHIVDMPSLPTLSDGTAGGIEPDAITFDLCRQVVDEYVLVDEAEIAAAMRLIMETHHLLVEGAAGVAVVGLLRRQADWRGRRVAVVLCGANIGLGTLKTILP